MPRQIAYEDYQNKRIYLHEDTAQFGVFPDLLQQEHRARRRLNENGERFFLPMVGFSGNNPKGGGKFTAKSTNLASGVRIVPYDRDQILKIKNEILCIDDGVSDQACFDRLSTLSNIDIDVDYQAIEIVTISVGSAVTEQDKEEIAAISARKVWETDLG